MLQLHIAVFTVLHKQPTISNTQTSTQVGRELTRLSLRRAPIGLRAEGDGVVSLLGHGASPEGRARALVVRVCVRSRAVVLYDSTS